MRSGSWGGTIVEQRRRIQKLLQDSPMRSFVEERFEGCYVEARQQAAIETGFSIAQFPNQNPLALEDVLQSEFFPD
jgi:Domain of unknown function DUF29